MSDSILHDELPAPEADAAALEAENALLRDRLMRALAEAENTRQRANRSAAEARQYAIADFAKWDGARPKSGHRLYAGFRRNGV